eukprot:4649401-Pyramimonas_sp.AAC.1
MASPPRSLCKASRPGQGTSSGQRSRTCALTLRKASPSLHNRPHLSHEVGSLRSSMPFNSIVRPVIACSAT